MTMEQYVKKGLSKTNGLEEVLARRQNEKIEELNTIKLDAMIAEEKEKLKRVSPPLTDSSPVSNIAATLFAGRRPEEIKQLLSTLTEEEIQKYSLIANQNNLSSFRGMVQAPNTSIKEIIEIVKLVSELQQPRNQGSNTNDMASVAKAITEAMKLGMEMSKSQQPSAPQDNVQFKLVESTLAELKATREETSRQDKLRLEREIEALKNRPSGLDELLYNEEKFSKVRKVFGGSDSAATNEFTLKKAEMDQTEKLENKKLDWEMKKWELDKEKEGNTLETVKEILEGPAGEILKSLGNAGAEKLRGTKAPSTNNQASGVSPKIGQVTCPNCGGIFPANVALPQIQCPLCAALLQNGNQPPPATQEPQNVAPPEEQPAPQSSSQPKNLPQDKPVDETVEAEPIAEPAANQ